MSTTNWQREDVTEHYLKQVRGGIPYGVDQVKIMLQVINYFCPHPKKIMDLGCGNGFLAEILLKSFPDAEAILIDHSQPMIIAAREYMNEYKDRCAIFHDDLAHSITKYAEPGSIDCIVSGFAIHHLPNEQKKMLYEDIYRLLADGGVFINIEHTASATREIEKLYDELFIDHISTYHQRNREEVAEEYRHRPDKEDNILEKVDIQIKWLQDLGFKHVDCYFKWMELAVFGGVK